MNPWGTFRAEDSSRISGILADYSAYVEGLTQQHRKLLCFFFGLCSLVVVVLLVSGLGIALFANSSRNHGGLLAFDVSFWPTWTSMAVVVVCSLLLLLAYVAIVKLSRERRTIDHSLDEAIEKLEELIRMASQFGAQIERGTENLIYADLALSKAELVLRRARVYR
jgi:hypothetical protein